METDKLKYYNPTKVTLEEVGGIIPSLKAMTMPKNGKSDSYYKGNDAEIIIGPKDKDLARRLIWAGNDHAKAMRGIIAWIHIEFQAGFMIEFETYRVGTECMSTTSSMHCELKGLSGVELADQKQKDLSTKIYKRRLHLSYQSLRSIYRARRGHRHPDWQIFCDFIETLPFFTELICPKREK